MRSRGPQLAIRGNAHCLLLTNPQPSQLRVAFPLLIAGPSSLYTLGALGPALLLPQFAGTPMGGESWLMYTDIYKGYDIEITLDKIPDSGRWAADISIDNIWRVPWPRGHLSE